VRYLFYHTRKRLSRLFSNFFKKFFELFVNLQSRNQSVLYSLFALFLTEKPLSFSSLSCDSSNILSYLQAIVKTFLNFFSKVFRVFFEFRFRNSILRTFIFDSCLSQKSPFYRVFSPLSRDSLFIIS
jgi:hypothetical protein